MEQIIVNHVQIDDKYVYRIPLKYFFDLGKINFPTKINLKIRYTLETEMKNLFQSKKILKQLKVGATADQQIPIISVQQLALECQMSKLIS